MAAIKEKWAYFESQLDKELENVPLLVFIQEKTQNKVHRAHIALGLVAFLFIFVLFGWFDEWVVNFIGFVFPAYMSIKAVQSAGKDDDTQWLTYWIVFGLFTVIEHTINYFFDWFFVIKFFIVLWLQSPVFNGATIFYHAVLAPIWGKIPSLPTQTKPAPKKSHKEHKSDDEDSEDD